MKEIHNTFYGLIIAGLFFSGILLGNPYVSRNFKKIRKEEFAKALKLQQEKGINLTATTNGSRFQGHAILQIVRWEQERDSIAVPLRIDYRDHFFSYLEVTRLTPEEAPDFVRLPYEHRQDILIEYRKDHVIEEVKEGPQPVLAVSVTEWWPDTPELPSKFFYKDTLSSPHLRATHHRVITYRIIDFGDSLYLYDDIRGITGRPLTGVLGLLFKVIGDGKVEQTRMIISEDGLQILRGTASKGFFSITETVTIFPDGRAVKDLPEGRVDLLQLEEKLKQAFEIEYYDPIFP